MKDKNKMKDRNLKKSTPNTACKTLFSNKGMNDPYSTAKKSAYSRLVLLRGLTGTVVGLLRPNAYKFEAAAA